MTAVENGAVPQFKHKARHRTVLDVRLETFSGPPPFLTVSGPSSAV